MKKSRFLLAIFGLVLSLPANANVINTLNGSQYEWLKVTDTQGWSRAYVETLLIDPNSSFYGYQYASRSLVEDLFTSYATWGGLNGYYGNPDIVSGVSQLINDFGLTYERFGYQSLTTIDGYDLTVYNYASIMGFYGATDECGTGMTCQAQVTIYTDLDGIETMALLSGDYGWSADSSSPLTTFSEVSMSDRGSFLVRPVVVPVPGAALLFISGLLGFSLFFKNKR